MCRTSCRQSQKKSRVGRPTLCVVTLAICCAILVGQPRLLQSQEAGKKDAVSTIDKQTAEASPPEEQRKKAMVGLLVLIGISMVGLFLLAVVIIWGHRIRRVSRQKLPKAGRGDELFYLKSSPKGPLGQGKTTTASQTTTDDDLDHDSSTP